ncbi:MAG TPA: hypothetical protein V6C58_25600 [Allocoleopsis sp.]
MSFEEQFPSIKDKIWDVNCYSDLSISPSYKNFEVENWHIIFLKEVEKNCLDKQRVKNICYDYCYCTCATYDNETPDKCNVCRVLKELGLK